MDNPGHEATGALTHRHRANIDYSRPLNVRITIRNNILLQAIKLRAKNVAEFCRLTDYPYELAIGYINMSKSPIYDRDGEWRDSAVRLCSLLDLDPQDGFPYVVLSLKVRAIELSGATFGSGAIRSPQLDEITHTETSQRLREVLDTIRPRERQVLEMLYGLKDGKPLSHTEVAKLTKSTPEKIRHLESRGLRKLRHPTRMRKLSEVMEAAYAD